MSSAEASEAQFLDNLPLIDRIIASICRRKACFGDDAEEFGQWAKVRLIDDGYRVFKKFEGRSSLPTYLNTVLHNLFRDWRISRWGKWRPSAAAKRMGATAVRLEALVWRDGFSFDEAVEILRQNHDADASDDELHAMAARLPQRTGRRFEGEETLERLGDDDGVERRVEDAELAASGARLDRALGGAFEALDGEDRLLVKLRFQDGFTVRQIASTMGQPARPLYSRFERCLRTLRRELERQGVSAEEVRGLLDWERRAIAIDYKLEEVGGVGKEGSASV